MIISAHPASFRGTFGQSSRNVKRVAVDAGGARRSVAAQRTSKSAWSWPPDAEVKPWVMSARRRGLSSPAPRGERAISRKPSRRECRTVRRTCGDCRLLFLLQAGHGCGERPAFPAPFVRGGPKMMQNSGTSCRGKTHARHCEERSDEAIHLSACRGMDCLCARQAGAVQPVEDRSG
jgi:hypothetical protein